MIRFKKRHGIILSIVVLVSIAAFLGLRKSIFRNESASCPNCRSFIDYYFEKYASENNGWFPKDGKTGMDSLALLLANDEEATRGVHFFTSHALSGDAFQYYKDHGTFNEEYFCYHYNEGLRIDDPSDMILLYFHEPTYWECQRPDHRSKVLSRNVMNRGLSWEFIPEDEFLARQRKTEQLIDRRKDRVSEIDKIYEIFEIYPRLASSDGDQYQIEYVLKNHSDRDVTISLSRPVSIHTNRGSIGSIARNNPKYDMPAGGEIVLEGKLVIKNRFSTVSESKIILNQELRLGDASLEIIQEDTINNGRISKRERVTNRGSGTGKYSRTFNGVDQPPDIVDESSTWCSTTILFQTNNSSIGLWFKSPKLYYLKD